MASSFTNQLVITSLAFFSIQSGLSQYSLTIVDSDDKQQSENNNRLKTRSNVSKAKKNNNRLKTRSNVSKAKKNNNRLKTRSNVSKAKK